jgi:hypothetical protein
MNDRATKAQHDGIESVFIDDQRKLPGLGTRTWLGIGVVIALSAMAACGGDDSSPTGTGTGATGGAAGSGGSGTAGSGGATTAGAASVDSARSQLRATNWSAPQVDEPATPGVQVVPPVRTAWPFWVTSTAPAV